MTYQDIENAVASLNVTQIKGKDYLEVNQRIKAFRMLFPDGTIQTEIVSLTDDMVVMKATVMVGGRTIGTGHAYELQSSSYINKTSFIENCETSAVGRALGMCGIGIDTSVCSADELTNALRQQNKNQLDDLEGIGKAIEEACKCEVCGKPVDQKIANASIKKYGKVYCSKACVEKAGAKPLES